MRIAVVRWADRLGSNRNICGSRAPLPNLAAAFRDAPRMFLRVRVGTINDRSITFISNDGTREASNVGFTCMGVMRARKR
jgi:hypothetical protein